MELHFKVVIYRDHCDKDIIEMCPEGEQFTTDHLKIQSFLKNVKATGGGNYPEAALDGLATAASRCKWDTSFGYRNLIIHIFDAPPHGDFPNYKQHSYNSDRKNCCCCNYGIICPFEWKTVNVMAGNEKTSNSVSRNKHRKTKVTPLIRMPLNTGFQS